LSGFAPGPLLKVECDHEQRASRVLIFIQLAVILIFCRALGMIAARLGQPAVVAEMIGGVLLGPSLFGWLWPDAQHWLFPWDARQQMRDTISEGLFACLVAMAVVTTLMTCPLFDWVASDYAESSPVQTSGDRESEPKLAG
jgi:Kef-type K+ transport system membrane component KefB